MLLLLLLLLLLQISEYIRSQSRASLAAAPGRLLPALAALGIGAAFMGAGVVIGGQGFTVDAIHAQAVESLARGAFDPQSLLTRFVFIHGAGAVPAGCVARPCPAHVPRPPSSPSLLPSPL